MGAIEIKGSLQKTELEKGLKQIQSVKQMKKTIVPISLDGFYSTVSTGPDRFPCFIFSTDKSTKPETIAKNVIKFYGNNNTPHEEMVNAIFITNVGTLYRTNLWGKETGYCFVSDNTYTFACMINFISHNLKVIKENIVKIYIADLLTPMDKKDILFGKVKYKESNL